MVKFKKKFNCFNLSFLSFHFIPQSIVLSTFKIFPTEKSFCFRDAKKKKENRFYASKCSRNVETRARCLYEIL